MAIFFIIAFILLVGRRSPTASTRGSTRTARGTGNERARVLTRATLGQCGRAGVSFSSRRWPWALSATAWPRRQWGDMGNRAASAGASTHAGHAGGAPATLGGHPVAGHFKPDGTKLADCRRHSACFEQAFGNLAYYEGPKRALAVFAEECSETDPTGRVCHRIAHALGAGALARLQGRRRLAGVRRRLVRRAGRATTTDPRARVRGRARRTTSPRSSRRSARRAVAERISSPTSASTGSGTG